MKAEHRKELHTNALADGMVKLVHGIKSKPPTSSITLWVIAGLALGTFLAWYFASGTSTAYSRLWVQIEDDSYNRHPAIAEMDLKNISQESPASIPGRTARFQEARLLLPQGLQQLCGQDRKNAIERLEKARKLYLELAKECADDALLTQEAMFGAAKAEEALVGVPKEGSDESSGSLSKALELYNQLAQKYGDSFLGKEAAARAKQIEANRADIEKFYVELNKLASGKK